MRLCVFEDEAVRMLEPLTLTRPAWALWCGASSLLERQKRVLAPAAIGALVRPELVDLCRAQNPQLPINDPHFLEGDDLVLVNARWLPAVQGRIDMARPHVGLVNGQIAYVALPPFAVDDFRPGSVQAWLDQCRNSMAAEETTGFMADFLWDLVEHNSEALTRDWEWFRQVHPSSNHKGAQLLGPANKLVVAEGALLEPYVVADTRQGPVLIEPGAVVHSFSRLEGPCYIGKETWIMGAKLRGGTLGPKCRIGGEVEASIVLGHSNKYHDGFLGHSYIGEWVNLAAGTQTSDLRNDYGPIAVTVAGRRIASGRTKIGSFIGDHTKTGLGVLLNTGSAIGTFANLLPAGSLLPSVVPSFCQVNRGQIQERQDLRQLFATAATAMGRRGETFTDNHRIFFQALYDRTADLRLHTIRETDARQLGRSV